MSGYFDGIAPLGDMATSDLGVVHVRKNTGGWWTFTEDLPDYVGKHMHLLTEEELLALPDGVRLVSIMGDQKVTGLSEIDLDTRYGHTAWGEVCPLSHTFEEDSR